MKKLFTVIMAMVMAMALLTGCAKGEENKDVEPTPTPSTEPQVEETVEEDPNYATVLAMWQDMDGYWVNEDGEYLMFKLDENGKAEMFVYDAEGALVSQMKASAVMASNKMSYYMAFESAHKGYFIELEGYGDGYVRISEESDVQEFEVYAYVGEDLEKLEDAIEAAEKLEKDIAKK